LFVSNSYEAIKECIARPAISKGVIHYSCPVKEITTLQEKNKVLVTHYTSSQLETNEFDAVILTVPLGCLKRSEPVIEPHIPPRLEEAIHNISYGRLEKALVQFPAAFWEESIKLTNGDKTSSMNGANKEIGRSLITPFTHFMRPSYSINNNPNSHNIECMALSTLEDGPKHPTLLFYVYGPLSTEMTTMLAGQEPDQESYQTLLREFLSPYYSKLPNYDANRHECSPKALLATSWQRSQYAGYGSYSNFQIPDSVLSNGSSTSNGFPELDKDIEVMREGLPDRGLWLAGEHTAPFVALGTVTGAYWSGESVAKRVLNWFKGKPQYEGVIVGPDEDVWKQTTVQVGKGGVRKKGNIEVA
jgi:hypothetical protein